MMKRNVFTIYLCLLIMATAAVAANARRRAVVPKGEKQLTGRILWRDDDLIFINIGRAHGVKSEMVFNVLSKRGRDVGVIEVVTVLEDNLTMCKAYMQITKMRKGFKVVFAEGKDRNSLQRELNIIIRREDQIKSVTGFVESLGESKAEIDVAEYSDQITVRVFARGLDALKITIPKLRDSAASEMIYRDFRLDDIIKLRKRDVIFNGKEYNIYFEGEVNLTKMVRELKRNGYTLSPKRLIMEFPLELERTVVSEIVKRISIGSKYIARDIIDIETPIPIKVFTMPQRLAVEISEMDFGSYQVYISRIYEDTLVFKVISPLGKNKETMDLNVDSDD